MTADEWLRLRDAIDDDIRHDLDALIREVDLTGWEGYNRLVGTLALWVAGLRIHPNIAFSVQRLLELQLTGLMVSKGQHNTGPSTLVQVLTAARDQLPTIQAPPQIPARPRLVTDEDED